MPVSLSSDDYIELLPMEPRAINSYGVKINHRVYDAEALNPYRGQRSGVKALKGLWEVHYDPYDVTRVWVRDHHGPAAGWMMLYWRQLSSAPVPFGDAVWNHARKVVAERGITSPSEATIAEAVDDLLDRASPVAPGRQIRRKRSAKDRRVVARTRSAAASPQWPAPDLDPAARSDDQVAPTPQDPPAVEQPMEKLADVIPLGVYDPHEEAKKWW